MKTLVTHNEFCHTDEVLATVVLSTIFNVSYSDVVRTRDNALLEQYAQDSDVLIYDVGGGQFDHHKKDPVKDGDRVYSSIGLIWKEFKEEILDTFHIDEVSWENIDRTLITPIDSSDNGGALNPFNYAFNGYTSTYQGVKDTFVAACEFIDMLFCGIINAEIKATNDRREFAALPTVTINNKVMKMATKMYNIGRTSNLCDGIITEVNGHYKILMLNGNKVSKCGISANEMDGVIFTHPAGFCGEVTDFNALYSVV